MKEDLKKLATEELEKKEKQLKGLTAFFIGILIVGLAASLYLAVTEKKFTGGLVAVLALAAILPMNFKNIKILRDEINLRK